VYKYVHACTRARAHAYTRYILHCCCWMWKYLRTLLNRHAYAVVGRCRTSFRGRAQYAYMSNTIDARTRITCAYVKTIRFSLTYGIGKTSETLRNKETPRVRIRAVPKRDLEGGGLSPTNEKTSRQSDFFHYSLEGSNFTYGKQILHIS
jgi:hypothetical protein